jgi:hypothetical protein
MLHRSEPIGVFGVDGSTKFLCSRRAMKISIHISHTEADDLGGVRAAAQEMGLDFSARGGFMGKQHAEITADLSPATLEALLTSLGARSALAA